MRSNLSLCLLPLLIFITSRASAEVLVLIHGYHSSGIILRSSGVIPALQAYGWADAGDYPMNPLGKPHGSMLYLLNRKSHPEIIWISLVRDSNQTANNDFIVPVYSQDMWNIPALRGSAVSYTVPVATNSVTATVCCLQTSSGT